MVWSNKNGLMKSYADHTTGTTVMAYGIFEFF